MLVLHYKLEHFRMQQIEHGADIGPQINKSRHPTLPETGFVLCFVLSLN